MKKLVLISPLSEAHRAAVARRFPELSVVDCSRRRDRVIEEIADAHIAYGMVKPEELRAAPHLAFIQAGWHGVENLCYPELIERGILLANCRGMCSQTMAEHVIAVVLALYRGIPRAVALQAQRTWKHEPASPILLSGKTMGCLGTGSIGRRIAEVSRALGCRTIGYNRRGAAVDGFDAIITDGERDTFLGSADVVVSSLPMTRATRCFMGREAFAAMKPTGVFVNVGRGGTVDEEALVEALETGSIAGACLDVTSPEPPSPESPLWEAKNCLITPHRSGASNTNEEAGYTMLMANLERFLAGEELLSQVDPTEGY